MNCEIEKYDDNFEPLKNEAGESIGKCLNPAQFTLDENKGVKIAMCKEHTLQYLSFAKQFKRQYPEFQITPVKQEAK